MDNVNLLSHRTASYVVYYKKPVNYGVISKMEKLKIDKLGIFGDYGIQICRGQ